MAPRLSPRLSLKAQEKLVKHAQELKQSSLNKQTWRQQGALLNALQHLEEDEDLLNEFHRTAKRFVMAGPNRGIPLSYMRPLLNLARNYLRQQALRQRLQPGAQSLNPSVIASNVNHPLNPCNPNNIANYLQLNPTLNPMFEQFINELASVEASQADEQVENQKQQQNTLSELLASVLNEEVVREATQSQAPENQAESNPHPALNLSSHASLEETKVAALSALVENAPEPNQEPSAHFKEAALAATALGFDKTHDHFLKDALHHAAHHAAHTPSVSG